MRRYVVRYVEEGKVRSREVVAPDATAAGLHLSAIQGVTVVATNEVCDGCDGLIARGFESPLNGDDHYCEMCTALDAFANADLEAIVVREERL